MDYLFLDIECSEGKSICSFGYVLTDALFNILEKKDILINPQSFFHTGPWKKKEDSTDEGITLAYPISEFKAQESFPYFYDTIKSIVTAKNRMVVGFSVGNDARFLNYACSRYHMPYFNFEYIDVQRICQDLYEEKNQIALEKMIATYDINIDGLVPHKSSDDAHITMLVLMAICAKLGKNIVQLAEEHPRAISDARHNLPKKKKPRPQGANTQVKAQGEKPQHDTKTAHSNHNNTQGSRKKYYHKSKVKQVKKEV